MKSKGQEIYDFVKEIYPIDRWLMGEGVRKTLEYIKREVPDLEIKSKKTGEKVFDWNIPKEWKIKDAYILNPKGKKYLITKK